MRNDNRNTYVPLMSPWLLYVRFRWVLAFNSLARIILSAERRRRHLAQGQSLPAPLSRTRTEYHSPGYGSRGGEDDRPGPKSLSAPSSMYAGGSVTAGEETEAFEKATGGGDDDREEQLLTEDEGEGAREGAGAGAPSGEDPSSESENTLEKDAVHSSETTQDDSQPPSEDAHKQILGEDAPTLLAVHDSEEHKLP